ncbi:acyl-CoA dehydrogenase [Tomitella biformata]|uniref:acyl-CoA dehydrogenase n=1 Tax=Tomitella biformata TaxID=630403 RepID=UPI000464AC34|nr:acyl-CoA dehydrogenase [Tomitella biformata]
MTIGLTEDTRDLRDAVRGWASRHLTPDVLRDAVNAESESAPGYWSDLAEQGLLGLHLPEEFGGAGTSLIETAVVVEELGRAMIPGAFTSTVLTGAVLADAGHTAFLAGFADGTVIGAMAVDPGTLTLTREDGKAVLDGVPGLIIGGALAAKLVLPAHDGDAIVWVVVDRGQVDVEELTSYDVTRHLVRVTVSRVVIDSADILSVNDSNRPLDLAATIFGAEASGMADWNVTTSAEYAKVRRQFGRPIGQFQGVKHRIARMLARAEQARACAWDAARALSEGGAATQDEASLAASVAGAVAIEAAFSTAKDNINNLGGIGFTWEHDAHLYLRRAQTLRIVLGSTAVWQQRVATLALSGVRRKLGVELPPEAEQIRAEIRAELIPAGAVSGAERTAYLAEHGYTAPHFPAPWGKGADAVSQLVIAEELAALELEAHDMVIGNWVVPTLIEHGSAEQQQRYIPGSLRGDIVWCQLFSEPGAGSDLAGLATKAVKVEGGWVLNGQKVWTSVAREADFGILLARTDADVAKHKGISYFVLDMKSAGLDIRPLREITGEALFNEVFLDNVFVPDDALIAQPGDGWKLARTTLANERVSLSRGSSLGGGGERLLEVAEEICTQRGEAALDAQMSTTLGQVLCDAQSGGLLALRGTIRSLSGAQPGAESSIAKLLGVDHRQQVWEVIMEWVGTSMLVGTHGRNDPTRWFLSTRNLSIAGGTTDVQLNIIGERLLGLPRDPAPGQ